MIMRIIRIAITMTIKIIRTTKSREGEKKGDEEEEVEKKKVTRDASFPRRRNTQRKVSPTPPLPPPHPLPLVAHPAS